MREFNIFEKIVYWFRSLFINKKKAKENSDKFKRQMCEWAVQDGVCTDHNCYACAWMTEDKEYEKDLNELKEQILKEGDTLVSKRDLFERFIKIDNKYEHRSWNLLQILANINILIGTKSCEDCISRQAVLKLQYRIDDSETLSTRDVVNVEDIEDLSSVTPKPKINAFDKIRVEIEQERVGYPPSAGYYKAITKCLQIIDKYKAKKEE